MLKKKIMDIISNLQTRFADFMNKKTKYIAMRKMKVLLVLFILAAGGYSLYLIADTFLSKSKTANVVRIERLTVPKYITPEETIESPVVARTDYLRMQAFRKYMDSLKVKSKRTYDSIMVFRPGLMDSISFLEKIYLSQNKN